MANQELTSLEQEMLDKYDEIKAESDIVVASLSGNMESVANIKDQICKIWSKIKPFISILSNIPFVGKYVKILSTLLDALCA